MEHKSLVVIDHYAYFNRANTRWSLWQQGAFEDPEACSCEPCINLRKHVIEDLPKIEEIKGGQKLCELTDSQRLLCPPRVFGYAMRDKLWAEVLVKNITKIDQESRKQAWDQLILDQRSKDILKTSVVEQAKNPNLLEDIIPGKGQGTSSYACLLMRFTLGR